MLKKSVFDVSILVSLNTNSTNHQIWCSQVNKYIFKGYKFHPNHTDFKLYYLYYRIKKYVKIHILQLKQQQFEQHQQQLHKQKQLEIQRQQYAARQQQVITLVDYITTAV